MADADPWEGQSLRGHTVAEAPAEGFPRHRPPSIASTLYEAAGVGFAVMSGFSHGITPVQGNYSPDKEFRYLRHLCYSPADFPAGWLGRFDSA